MAQAVVTIGTLARAPLDAAAEFHARHLPDLRRGLGRDEQSSLVVIFPIADHTHRAWRLAAIQELAREAAPGRANALCGTDPDALREALDYLAAAAGVTGQVLVAGNAGETL